MAPRANRRKHRGGPLGRRTDEAGNADRYQMTQKLVSIGDDYFVENAAGERVFRIDGKALRVRDTLQMEDLQTGDDYRLQEKLLRVKDSMTVTKDGQKAAVVKKAIVSPIRDRFTVSIPGTGDLKIKGNVLDHEYRLMRDDDRVAEVSKKWFRVRDSYGIEVEAGMDAGLVVACTVALDMMAHQGR